MLWFPGSNQPQVRETIGHGLTYGLVSTTNGPTRIWHGDDVVIGPNNLATVVAGPAHAACEAEYARRSS